MASKKGDHGLGTVGYLAVFSGILALAYLVIYLNAGINNTDNFSRMWMDLVIGLLFLGTTLLIFRNKYYGWILYLISLCAILARCIAWFSVGVLPMIVLTIFALLHLMSDEVKSEFGA